MIRLLTIARLGSCLAAWFALTAPLVFAQSGGKSMVAEPATQASNPFLPSRAKQASLPVTLNGFCVVSLRERQEWVVGSEAHQLVFDGQLYWFAGPRERAIFAATPKRYVPALGGDCVVTYADSGTRSRGDPHYGILHDKRLFFFYNQVAQEKFRAAPEQFAKLDLANKGNCLVSQLEDERQRPGLPETTTIVNGMRYRFAGVHQQRKFLTNMQHYGVQAPVTPRTTASAGALGSSPAPGSSELVAEATKKAKKAVAEKKASEIENKAMSGYCPVSIRNHGTWVAGSARYLVEFDGQNYLFAGESEMTLFQQDPTPYLPALGGHCVVTEIDENRRVGGSIYHAAMHEGEDRLFLFAGPAQKEAFNAEPEKYLQADLAAEGNCIVNLLDTGREIVGNPELMTWHNSKRYFFATEAHQEKFSDNVERYQQH